MLTLPNEEILLNSDDNSITLTTQRLIHKTKDISQEVFLKDIVGYEIIYKKELTFLIIGIIGGVISYVYQRHLEDYGGYGNNMGNSSSGFALFLLIFVSIALLICYFRVKGKYLKVTGRYNSIEFSVKNLTEERLSNFTNKISTLSDKIKKESQ